MVLSVNDAESGLLIIPMMGKLLVATLVSGQLVRKTGWDKRMPIVGSVLVASALVLPPPSSSAPAVGNVPTLP